MLLREIRGSTAGRVPRRSRQLIEFQKQSMTAAKAKRAMSTLRATSCRHAAPWLGYCWHRAWLSASSSPRQHHRVRLNEAVPVAQKVADGDLTSADRGRSKDETGQLLQALKDMNESLVKIVGDVRAAADSIAHGIAADRRGQCRTCRSAPKSRPRSLEETASLDGRADLHGEAERGERASRPINWRLDASRGGGARAARWWARW